METPLQTKVKIANFKQNNCKNECIGELPVHLLNAPRIKLKSMDDCLVRVKNLINIEDFSLADYLLKHKVASHQIKEKHALEEGEEIISPSSSQIDFT